MSGRNAGGATLRVAALTGGTDEPSSRFRVRQLVEPLAALGVDVRERIPAIERHARCPLVPRGVPLAAVPPLWAGWQAAKLACRIPGLLESRRSDVTWLERGLLPAWPSIEPLLSRPLVLDVDDALWLQRPFGVRALAWAARHADAVVAGNRFLAEWFSGRVPRVEVVPTAVDVRRIVPRPRPESAGPRRRVFGWMGSRWTLPALVAIEAPLRRVLAAHDAELLVVADAAPEFTRSLAARVRFVPWSSRDENALLNEMDVGLAPLPDDEWSRGKCGAKVLLYMAAGIPVVGSPVGGQEDLFARSGAGLAPRTLEDWAEALDAVASDEALGARLGENGRRFAEGEGSTDRAAERLAKLFRDLAQRR